MKGKSSNYREVGIISSVYEVYTTVIKQNYSLERNNFFKENHAFPQKYIIHRYILLYETNI
jgi:hypothetical protein